MRDRAMLHSREGSDNIVNGIEFRTVRAILSVAIVAALGCGWPRPAAATPPAVPPHDAPRTPPDARFVQMLDVMAASDSFVIQRMEAQTLGASFDFKPPWVPAHEWPHSVTLQIVRNESRRGQEWGTRLVRVLAGGVYHVIDTSQQWRAPDADGHAPFRRAYRDSGSTTPWWWWPHADRFSPMFRVGSGVGDDSLTVEVVFERHEAVIARNDVLVGHVDLDAVIGKMFNLMRDALPEDPVLERSRPSPERRDRPGLGLLNR